MDVTVETRRGSGGKRNHIWPERKVRDEMCIHHVEMECLRAGSFGTEDFICKPPEIGGKKRWKYLLFHRRDFQRWS